MAEQRDVMNGTVGVPPAPVMRLDGVSYAVADHELLAPMDLELGGLGMTGLVGQNGSGKSTLLRILARQLAPTRGGVQFRGEPLAAWREREFARYVAYLPQYTPLAAGLTVRELVALGRYPWHGPLGRFGPRDQGLVSDALSLTDTDRFADRFVDTLSGGERQRAWLAMLLAQDAQLLLLDEPISALDVAHQVEVLELIRRISQERRRAVLIVIHEINLAARFCDELVALKAGHLIAQGPPEEFMNPARLREIYDVDMDVLQHPRTGSALACVRD